MSLPMRGAWIEIYYLTLIMGGTSRSLPMRGAWIEIGFMAAQQAKNLEVAPHAGSVD